MRKLLIAGFVSLSALFVLAGALQNGYGKTITATTTPQSVALGNNDWAYEVSVFNNGAQNVRCMKNISTNDFVATNAVVVPAGKGYTFRNVKDGGQKQYITNIVIDAESSTSETFIAFN